MQEQIKTKIMEAMKARDEVRLNVYRGISAAFTNELVAKGKTPQEKLSDDECLAVIRRLVKQRKDSIEQFEKGGRPELADVEKTELKVLEELLPAMMSAEDIRKIAVAKKEALGVTDKSKSGILIGAILKETKGLADGGDVKKVVDELFD